jgi:hypothetical protein
VPSPYPPGALLFSRGVTAIQESTFALKVAFVVCDLAIVFVLVDILRRTQQGKHWVLAYAWNPLLATEVAGSGHIDIVGALLLLVSAPPALRSMFFKIKQVTAICMSATTNANEKPVYDWHSKNQQYKV